jgi:hypothetical protein
MPGLAVRGTFSPARAWRPAVVARLARTLGVMFSAHKRALILIQSAAIVAAIGHLLFAVLLLREGTDAQAVHPAILLTSLIALGLLAATSELDQELNRALEGQRSSDFGWWTRTQMRLHWCPVYLMFLYPVALVLRVYALYLTGFDMSWSGHRPLTRPVAASFSLWASMILFASVPILASASRMPGTYAAQYGPSATGSNDA